MKKGTKTILIGLIIILLAVIVIIATFPSKERNENENYEVKTYKGEKYYIITDDYENEYQLEYLDLSDYYNQENGKNVLKEFIKQEVMTYDEYKQYCETWNIEQKYQDEQKNYIVMSYDGYGYRTIKARLADVKYDHGIATLYVWDAVEEELPRIAAYVLIIPTSPGITKVETKTLITSEEYKKIKKDKLNFHGYGPNEKKPIIYLYPEKEQEISVKVINKDKLLTSYPLYENEWLVNAKPNGDLKDIKTGKSLYALYYEIAITDSFKIEDEGFVVKGTETIKFLEEKLSILGLNSKESEEFIIYWLPILERNNYNYIRFATQEEIEKNSPLEITPKPTTEIRVLMTYKGLDKPISVKEQELKQVKRKGYTMVEWGGSEIQ